MTKMITVRDTLSGRVGVVPESYLSLPGFQEHLVRAEDGAKNYEPSMYKPTDAKGYRPRQSTVKEKAAETVSDETQDSEIQ